MVWPRHNFYRLPPGVQRRRTIEGFCKYLRQTVYPYHPFLRRLYDEKGIDVRRLRGYEGVLSLPVLTKDDLRSDPAAFVLQPTVPGRPGRYKTEKISLASLARSLLRAVVNRPREYGHLYRRMPLLEGKLGRRLAWEWMPIHFHASGGSTGEPVPVTYTFRDIQRIIPELSSMLLIQPDRPEPDRLHIEWTTRNMNLFPGAPHLAFFQAVLSKVTMGLSSFDACGGKVIPTVRQVEIFARGEFDSLNAIPSYLAHWLRKAVELREAGRIAPLNSLKFALVAAEPVTPEFKARLKELAAAAGADPRFVLLEGYGMTEARWAFTECDEGTGIHLNPRFWLWELLNPETLQPVDEGRPGLLVFSHIGWHGTVLVRYNTGDLITGGMRTGRCPACGYTMPRLFGPIVRHEHDFTKLRGARINLQRLVATVRDLPGIRTFRIFLEKSDPTDPLAREVMRVVAAARPGVDPGELKERVTRAILAETELTPDLVELTDDADAIDSDLFQRTGIKADYLVDLRRPPAWSVE